MPTSTYDLIASNVLGSSAASVTFSSIPATYRDLVLVCEVLGSGGNVTLQVQVNSDTGSNYSNVLMQGNGSAAISTSDTVAYLSASPSGTAIAAQVIHQFLDYSVTDKHKTVLTRAGRSDLHTRAYAQRWADTSAINSLYIYPAANQFAAGSSFYLYGIVS